VKTVRRRRQGAFLLVLGAALVAIPFAVPPARAQTGFVGYLFTADSDGIDQTGGSPGSQGYPQQANETAHTTARIDTGPNGYALASSQWPGDFVGNVGSLAQVFGAPPEAGQANYPVRAEASTSGQQEATASPGMSASAKGPTAEAVALYDGYDGGESMSFGNVESRSSNALEGDVGVARASTNITDFTFGGQIKIKSIKTEAGASTDGTTGKAEGQTLVNGLEVAGQPAYVDQDGVHAGTEGQPNPADAVAQLLIDQVLSNFKDGAQVDMHTTNAFKRSEGGLQEYRSGALVITIVVGDPSGDGGVGTFVLGGSNALASASADSLSGIPDATPGATDVGSFDVAQGDAVADVPIPSGGSAAPSTPAPSVAGGGPSTGPSALAVSRFSGLGFAMPFFVLLGSLVIGRGLHLLHGTLVNAPLTTACIAEKESM
jgi:hypothetical protein